MATLVKEYLGASIYVDDKGKYSVRLPSGAKKESMVLRTVEKFVASYVPKGSVDLVYMPSRYNTSSEVPHVTITGIVAAEGRPSAYNSNQPRLVIANDGKDRLYRSEPRTMSPNDLGWPDPELEAEIVVAVKAKREFDAAHDAKMAALAKRFKPASLKDIQYALEHGGQPA